MSKIYDRKDVDKARALEEAWIDYAIQKHVKTWFTNSKQVKKEGAPATRSSSARSSDEQASSALMQMLADIQAKKVEDDEEKIIEGKSLMIQRIKKDLSLDVIQSLEALSTSSDVSVQAPELLALFQKHHCEYTDKEMDEVVRNVWLDYPGTGLISKFVQNKARIWKEIDRNGHALAVSDDKMRICMIRLNVCKYLNEAMAGTNGFDTWHHSVSNTSFPQYLSALYTALLDTQVIPDGKSSAVLSISERKVDTFDEFVERVRKTAKEEGWKLDEQCKVKSHLRKGIVHKWKDCSGYTGVQAK